MCRSLARSRSAWATSRLTIWTTGAFSSAWICGVDVSVATSGGDRRSRAREGADLRRQVAGHPIAVADRLVDLRAQRQQRDDRPADERPRPRRAWLRLPGSSVATSRSSSSGPREGEGHHPEAPGVRLGQGAHRGLVARPLAQVDERRVELDREDRGERDLVDDAVLAQDLAESLASLPLGARGRRSSCASVMRPASQQQVAHPRRRRGPARSAAPGPAAASSGRSPGRAVDRAGSASSVIRRPPARGAPATWRPGERPRSRRRRPGPARTAAGRDARGARPRSAARPATAPTAKATKSATRTPGQPAIEPDERRQLRVTHRPSRRGSTAPSTTKKARRRRARRGRTSTTAPSGRTKATPSADDDAPGRPRRWGSGAAGRRRAAMPIRKAA